MSEKIPTYSFLINMNEETINLKFRLKNLRKDKLFFKNFKQRDLMNK